MKSKLHLLTFPLRSFSLSLFLFLLVSACSSTVVVDEPMLNGLADAKCQALTAFSNNQGSKGFKQLQSLSKQIGKIQETPAEKITISQTQQAQLRMLDKQINSFLIPYRDFQSNTRNMDNIIDDLINNVGSRSYLHLEGVSIKTAFDTLKENLHYYYRANSTSNGEINSSIKRINESILSLKKYAKSLPVQQGGDKVLAEINSLHISWVKVKKHIATAGSHFAQAAQQCPAAG